MSTITGTWVMKEFLEKRGIRGTSTPVIAATGLQILSGPGGFAETPDSILGQFESLSAGQNPMNVIVSKDGSSPNLTVADAVTSSGGSKPFDGLIGFIPVVGLSIRIQAPQDVTIPSLSFTVAGQSMNGVTISYSVTTTPPNQIGNRQDVEFFLLGCVTSYNNIPIFSPFRINDDGWAGGTDPTIQAPTVTWTNTFNSAVRIDYNYLTRGNPVFEDMIRRRREYWAWVDANAFKGAAAAAGVRRDTDLHAAAGAYRLMTAGE